MDLQEACRYEDSNNTKREMECQAAVRFKRHTFKRAIREPVSPLTTQYTTETDIYNRITVLLGDDLSTTHLSAEISRFFAWQGLNIMSFDPFFEAE